MSPSRAMLAACAVLVSGCEYPIFRPHDAGLTGDGGSAGPICPGWDVRPITRYDSLGSATVLVAIDDRSVLVATDTNELFRAERGAELAERLTLSSTVPNRAGLRTRDGEIWLGGYGGEIAALDASLRFVRRVTAAPLAAEDAIEHMDEAPRGSPFELYVATMQRALLRWDGTTWQELKPPRPLEPFDDIRHRQVRWIAPGQAVAALSTGNNVWRYTRATDPAHFTEERFVSDWEGAIVNAVLYAPPFGVIAVTSNPNEIRGAREDGRWTSILIRDVDMHDLERTRNGFAVGADRGLVLEIVPGPGGEPTLCQEVGATGGKLWKIARVGDSIAVAGAPQPRAGSPINMVGWLEPR